MKEPLLHGYHGKILDVDLTAGAARTLPLDEKMTAAYLGGRGLATRLFCDLADPGCDPLGPDNVLVLATSPLIGTKAPTSCRGHLVFKSPLTNTMGSANSGGRFGKVLKSTGYDAVVIQGRSSSPVYVLISDRGEDLSERVRVMEAGDLWGMSVPEVSDVLAGRHGGREASVLATGPAGERLVRFASLMNEKNRA